MLTFPYLLCLILQNTLSAQQNLDSIQRKLYLKLRRDASDMLGDYAVAAFACGVVIAFAVRPEILPQQP